MQNPLPEYERCLQNYSMSFLCQNKGLHKSLHAKFDFIWKIWAYITFSFVSHGSSPRPTLEASVSLAKVPDFLAELLPTGAFYPQAVLLLPGAFPHSNTHTPTPTPIHPHTDTHPPPHYFILTPAFPNVCVPSPPFMALLDSEGVIGINGSHKRKWSWYITC